MPKNDTEPMARLLSIMARLRDRTSGCPWDREQNFRTIAPYTVEEAYEVADAIERGDFAALREELGDLLFQVVFYAQMGSEEGRFTFADIAGDIADKMVRRHPHVFGDAEIKTAADQTRAWEDHKAAERAIGLEEPSALDGVPLALPALTRAEKLQKRASRVGFDWPEAAQVLDKIEEEIAELRAEIGGAAAPKPNPRIEDEIGDLFFALVNLARHLGCDSEQSLRGTNAKFERRFRAIEAALARDGRNCADATLDEMEALWVAAKRAEKTAG